MRHPPVHRAQLRSLETRKGIPLYLTLRDVFAKKIATREWQDSEPIPAEDQLARHYGVALGTMRRAIEELVREGLLERVQGVGTFIRRPDFSTSLFRFLRFRASHSQNWLPESRVLSKSVRRPPPGVAAKLRLSASERGIVIRRLRLFDKHPHVAEHIWVSAERFTALVDMPKEEIGPLLYRTYEETCGQIVASAEENLRVSVATSANARLLGVSPGAPMVIIERTAFNPEQEPIEWRRSQCRADNFNYRIEIR